MNHTTFETSKRLKEAGFPQPEPDFGKIYYDKESEQKIVVIAFDGEYVDCVYQNLTWVSYYIKISDLIFAPTATDILREMPEHDLTFWHPQQTYYVEDTRNGIQWTNNNPADAAALAYLKLNEKDNLKQPDYWFDEL